MIIYGSEISKKIKAQIKTELDTYVQKPLLAVILVGNNPASLSYIKGKEKACLEVGINYRLVHLEETTTQAELIDEINKLNHDDEVNGILLQLPLPKHLDERRSLDCIDPNKDVDGLTTASAGKLYIGQAHFIPCTPLGVMSFFDEVNYDLSGKNVLIVGRSNLVGLPLMKLLLNSNATVTVAHSKTKNLRELSKNSDVVVVAIGRPRFLDDSYFNENAFVIDVGINRVDGKICGDVDFDKVCDKVKYLTPVPKGVGPLTIASLIRNTMQAFLEQHHD